MDLQLEDQVGLIDWYSAIICKLPASFLFAKIYIDGLAHIGGYFEGSLVLKNDLVVNSRIMFEDVRQNFFWFDLIVTVDSLLEIHVVFFVESVEELVAE